MLSVAYAAALIVLCGQDAGVTSLSPAANEIARAIEQLADDSFEVRQQATDLLWRAGAAAEGPLRTALKSTEPEVRTRAATLLERLRYGIRPDTPTEILVLVEQFRFGGTANARRQALAGLQAKAQWQVIIALLRGEENPEERRALTAIISADAGKLVQPLVEQGDLAQAEEILELVASGEAGLPQLTSFLLVTDRLERQIELARQQAEKQPQDASWIRLAYLLRAKGDLPAAIEAADKTSDLVLRSNLNAEGRRWREAAAAAEELFRLSPNRLEAAAFATTFYRLAGNQADHQRTLDSLLKSASVNRLKENTEPQKPAEPFGPADNVAVRNLLTAAKTLLVNERIDEALEIMRKINPPFAHMIYWRQHRHREALELASVTPEKKLDRAWLDQLPAPPPLLPVRPDYRFIMAAQVARQLRELGRNEQVDQIWQLLRDMDWPQADRARRLSLLALVAWQLGRYDQATSDATDAIAAGMPPAAIFTMLANREGPLALAWYEWSLAADPQAPRQTAIATAVWLVTPNPRRGNPPENWRQLVAAARASVQDLPPPAKAERLVAFGHTCKIRGDLDLARQLFTEAAEANPATSMHIGDLAAAAGNWAEAARHYAAAAKAKPADRLAGFLLGHALSKSGDSEAGARQLGLANLAVLAPADRLALATAFRDPSLKDEAIRQLEIVCRTALPDSTQATNAAQTIGNIVSTQQPRRSAHCWEQMLLHVLNPSTNFNEPEAYPALSHVIHKVLARAALADGQTDAVAAELAHCDKLLPADLRLVLNLVPALRRGGMTEIADQLFDRALAVHRQVLEDFPASATYLNNAAWLCARSQRKLDEALAMAEKAVALLPDEPAYHDTLAEVHFQRGDRAAAIAAAQKCLDLAPGSKLFAARLKHFHEDELKTLDGTEVE